MKKQDKLTAAEKKAEKIKQKVEYHSKYWSEKTMRYFVEIHNLKSKIKGMQELNDEDKTGITTKNIIKNLIYLNCSSLTVLMNILKLVNNLKFITDFINFFNHTCENINIIYQLATQFLLLCHKEENWVPSDNLTDIKMMISACYEADDTFLWPFEVRMNVTVFFDKDAIAEKDKNLKKENKEVNFEVLNE